MTRRDTPLAIFMIGALALVAAAPAAEAAECPDFNGGPQTIEGCLELTRELSDWASAMGTWAVDLKNWAEDPAFRTAAYEYAASLNTYAASNTAIAADWAHDTASPAFDVVTFVVIDGTTYAIAARAGADAYVEGYQNEVIAYATARTTQAEPYVRLVGDQTRANVVAVVAFAACYPLVGGCPTLIILIPNEPDVGTVPTPDVPQQPGLPDTPPTPATPGAPALDPCVPTGLSIPPPPNPPAPPIGLP
jgi:hypothetical protein